MSTTPILIIGATTGGVAAALSVARLGTRCILIESGDWLGGQLTSQAVPPDENQWVETFGATETYQKFRSNVRAWYRKHRPLTPVAAAEPNLNPGNGWVSRLCFEPTVGEAVLREMLAPFLESGLIELRLQTALIAATHTSDIVSSIQVQDLRTGTITEIRASFILDATDLGDLLPLAMIDHAIGAEHRDVYGELHGRTDRTDPLDQQPISWCFAMGHDPHADHRITRPARYDFWKSYIPPHTDDAGRPWPGPLFSWTIPSHDPGGVRTLAMTPAPDAPADNAWELWRYRRITDAGIYTSPEKFPDISLVNWVQMDYWLKPLLGVTPAEQAAALAEAREQSLCLFYWMQHDCPRHDSRGGGYPGLYLRGDCLGTTDGFAKAAYIREPRRLLARTMLTEAHIGTEQRTQAGSPNMDATPFGTCHPFKDSIGIGHYRIDLHPSCSGRGAVYVPAAPFRIPMGALIPRNTTNVMIAGKAIGVSHIANGCTRMHHTEWNIGESAGALAAWCITRNTNPAAVHDSPAAVLEFQQTLSQLGIRIAWPWES